MEKWPQDHQRDVELLLTMTGTDMGNIRMELEKMISYTVGRDVVTAADIRAVCTTQTTNKIFDMVRAVTEKNQKRALDLYYDLLTLREPPMRILFLLAKQFRQICLTKKMSQEGLSQTEIASKLGVPSFVVRNLASCARSLHCGRAGECRAGFCGCGRGGKDRYTWRCAQRGASDREVQLGESSESLSFTKTVLPQGRSVVPEPFFAGFILRHHRCHHCIKGRGMIHFFSVGKLCTTT